ncbi:MAG: gamma carbonic anhydrase family protein [Euryarchaeota archaeon]|nr:gamma carbonic anhydrase family protein [Euryarchaeota archaeon]
MKRQIIDDTAYISERAFISGDVEIEAHASIWPFASIRGDRGKISVGKYSNIQDNATIHEKTSIGAFVSVGHNAVIHGCTIDNNVIVGMHATILNSAKIGKNCVIGANTLITEGKETPENSLIVGSPGKVIKKLNENWHEKIRKNAEVYHELSQRYKEGVQ